MKNNFNLPKDININHLINVIRNLSWGAADILIAYSRGKQPPFGYEKVLSIEELAGGPITAADLAVNDWLLKGIKKSFPSTNWFILSEETAKEDLIAGKPLDNEWLWILDPLDGTKDFISGTGEYAVHLALLHKNIPIFGVVLIPELEELWFGIVGDKAWCEDRKKTIKMPRFSTRKITQELILVTSRSHKDHRLDKLLEIIPIKGSKSVGSVGCKICTILRGETDLYISISGESAPKDWDMAAPEAVLKAAGGKFCHADKKHLKYNKGDTNQRGCIIASNGLNHESLCDEFVIAFSQVDNKYKF